MEELDGCIRELQDDGKGDRGGVPVASDPRSRFRLPATTFSLSLSLA
jgi:hypothetical protein